MSRSRRVRRARIMTMLTQNPTLSLREIAAPLGVSPYTVRCDMEALRRMGYIEFSHHTHRNRRVLVPFVDASLVTFRSN